METSNNNNNNNNNNNIYFKSLKSQWFSGPYMSIHTKIQTFKHTQYEKMKKTSSKNTYLSKYLYIYHSSHHSYIKKQHIEHEEKQIVSQLSFVAYLV